MTPLEHEINDFLRGTPLPLQDITIDTADYGPKSYTVVVDEEKLKEILLQQFSLFVSKKSKEVASKVREQARTKSKIQFAQWASKYIATL